MPLTKWQPPAPRHSVAEDGRVTWLELFFDLVYVAALIQLGDRLAGDITWSGFGAFAGAFVLLWWTWTGTTAFTNRFAVDDITHRLLTFAQMFAVGNLAVIAATTPDNWRTWLVISYIGARLPLLAMYLRAVRSNPQGRPIALLFARAFGASLLLWLGSLAVPGDARFVVWGAALLFEFAAPAVSLRRPSDVPIHDEHFQERYALFTIIVLGESFVKTLSEVSKIGISLETQVFGGLGFCALIAVWWTYFDDVADAHIKPQSVFGSSAGLNRLIWVCGGPRPTHELPPVVGISVEHLSLLARVDVHHLASVDPVAPAVGKQDRVGDGLEHRVVEQVEERWAHQPDAREPDGPRSDEALAVLPRDLVSRPRASPKQRTHRSRCAARRSCRATPSPR